MKAGIFAVMLMLAPCASAQGFPQRAIRMVVPYPPGGPNDILGRVIAQKLAEQFGQQVVVDNRGGAGSTIGADLAARAAPDGYTILLGGTASLSIAPSLYPKLPYDPIKDFAPVSLVATAPSILVTHPSVPAATVKDLIGLCKARPRQLNYASAGVGSPPHLAAELFKSMAGVDIVHVPYKGGGPALTDLVGGQIEIYFGGISAALPLVKQGKLRGIAVTSAKRTAIMPEMPTIAESGLPGYEVVNWYAILVPAATPQAVVTRLNGEIIRSLEFPEIRKRFLELAADPASSTPGELAAYTRREISKWAAIIRSAGIKAE